MGFHRNFERDGRNGAQIGGDIFTDFSIAARGALHKDAVMVMQHHGQPVDLGFQHKAALAHTLV